MIVRGTRLIIPKDLRQRVINIAHEGHQGMVKTKERLRTKCWWPGMDKETEKEIRSCHECQLVSQPTKPEPMIRTKFPEGPWEDVAIDLLGPLPSGESILVVVDYYSRYFEIAILRVTDTKQVIKALDVIFARHGLPVSVRADNGPQFVSDEFKAYVKEHNIELRHSTPLWPQANGEVERQNRSLKKSLIIAHSEGKDWRQELNKFLLAYRSTPHQTTGVSPAELLFGRKIRTKLPELDSASRPILDEAIRDRDILRKQRGKEYADEKRQAKDSGIRVGDEVLLKQKPANKLTTAFEPKPYRVVEKEGSQVTVQSSSGVKYKRNVAHTKPYVRKEIASTPTDTNSSEERADTEQATQSQPHRE